MTDRVTITDVRRAGFCARGVRTWFLDNGFSREEFKTFLAEGIPKEDLLYRGDHLARVVVDRMESRGEG